jgi:GNAT superfamily N-acetyltransferase
MLPLWRVTRNRFGKRLHARLDDVGITVSRLDEYRVPLPADYAATTPDDVSIRPVDPGSLPADVPVEELVDDETVLTAVDDGVAGYVFVSVGARVPVPELGTEMAFDGAYVRRLYVDPAHRRRGIASGLVDAAKALGADQGADAAVALVAVDNRPSQWTFEARGFEPVARHVYDRLGRLERRRRRSLIDD